MKSAPTDESLHVVLIGNDRGFAETCKRTLERAGFEVLIAGDGSGGLKLVESVLPDVVVLDLRLQDILDVLAALKSSRSTVRIPVGVLSNDTSKTAMRHCRRLGAVDYLAKSANSPAILVRLLPAWAGKIVS